MMILGVALLGTLPLGCDRSNGVAPDVMEIVVPLRYEEDSICLRNLRIKPDTFRGLWWRLTDGSQVSWLPWRDMVRVSGDTPGLELFRGGLCIYDPRERLLSREGQWQSSGWDVALVVLVDR